MNKVITVGTAVLTVAAMLACTGTGTTEPACDLNVDNLVGKSFVMAEAQPQGPAKNNPLARLKFVDEGGLKVKYTAMSVSDVYTYECTKKEEEGKDPELLCAEKERLQDWCEAILARDKTCTRKKLQKLGATASDEEIDKAIKAAKDAWKKVEAEGSDRDKKLWKLRRQSLANKLQGRLFAKVDSRCRLRIDDLYWTLKPDGEKVEDSNPAGTNPFVQSDEPWLFEHCTETAALWDVPTDAFPTEPLAEAPQHEMGKPIYYFHTGKTASEPEEGCTYSYDTYAGWLPDQQGLTPEVKDGKLIWRGEHTYSDKDVREVNGKQGALYHMVRYKECGGKKETIDVACRASVF